VTCIICHQGETSPGTTTVTFHEAGRTTVVNEVPAEVCENCGEAYVAEDTTTQLPIGSHRARPRLRVCCLSFRRGRAGPNFRVATRRTR
jgi:YgiT-type zinc finger domain-containing protein